MTHVIGFGLFWKRHHLEINLYTFAWLRRIKKGVKDLSVKSTRKKTPIHSKLHLIKCGRCGAEIMLVRDVKLMSDAIEAHVEMHKSKMRSSSDAEAEAEQIRDDLIRQVLDMASEQGALIAEEEDTNEP